MKRLLILISGFIVFNSCTDETDTIIEVNPSFESSEMDITSLKTNNAFKNFAESVCSYREFQAEINNTLQFFESKRNEFKADALASTSDVKNIGGVLYFKDLETLLRVNGNIDKLNNEWDEMYSIKINELAEQILGDTRCPTPGISIYEKEAIIDELEDNCFFIEEDIGSLIFEETFKFNSLRKQKFKEEEAWLENGGYANGDYNNPIFSTRFDYTLMTFLTNEANPRMNITNMDFNSARFGIDTLKSLLDIIEDLIGVVGGAADVGEQIVDLLEDCDESAEGKIRRVKANQGYEFYQDGKKRVIGYEMEQRSVTFDFSNTTTKIKGKAKLYRHKKKNRYKKDKNNRVGIQFCAQEWNGCDEEPWPSDGGTYESPQYHKNKKVNTGRRTFPYALTIRDSYDFLSFSFYYNEQFKVTKPLLNNNTMPCDYAGPY